MRNINGTILFLDNHDKSKHMYTLALEVYLNYNVIEMSDFQDAIDYLESFSPDLIITRAILENKDCGLQISTLIKNANLKSKMIILGKSDLKSDSTNGIIHLVDDISVKDLIKNAANLLNIKAIDMARLDVGAFFSIEIKMLPAKLILVCPIYKKISEDNYEKILDIESQLHPEVLFMLNYSGQEFVYVKANDRLKFVNSLSIYITEMIASDRLTLEDSIIFGNDSYNLVKESVQKMSISLQVINATEVNINNMLSMSSKVDKLDKYLKLISTDKTSLIFRHCLLTCFISSHIINKMDWGTNDQKVKLAFVCFFSNMFLDNDQDVFVKTDLILNTLSHSTERYRNINDHALNAAKFLSKYYANLPFGVETIIKQHHGNKYGVGFDLHPSSVSPLALIYLVADDWVCRIMDPNGAKINKGDFLSIIKNNYKGIMFLEIIKAVEDLDI